MSNEPPLLFSSRATALDRGYLRGIAKRIAEEAAEGRSFTVLLAGDRRLRQLNRDFRGKDESTDVLSFPCPGADGSLGDLAISIQRAAEQAERYGHGVNEEIAILMLHGVLHLMGHDHETDRGAMRRLESRWRRKLGLPVGLIERARR